MRNISLLLLFCLILFSQKVAAQDIIVKSDGTIIRAVINEIDDNTIMYHQWEDPSGPAFRIGLDRVVKVQFQNGTEQTFSRTQRITSNDDFFTPRLDKSGRLEYMGKGDFKLSGRKIYDNSQLKDFLASEGYYETFRSAQSQRRAGNVFIPVGAGLIGLGTVCAAVTISDAVNTNKEDWQTALWRDPFNKGYMIASISFYAVGGTLLSLGIPLKIIGTKRLKWIADDYNTHRSHSAELTFGPTSDGFGLLLYF